MNIIFKNILAILAGIAVGMIVNMTLIIAGSQLIPFSEIMDPMNAKMWEIKYFTFPFLAHSIGTLSGAFIVSKLSKKTHIIMPLIVGLYFLFGGLYMVTILPAPTWFVLLDIILCYIPMALLGWKIVK